MTPQRIPRWGFMTLFPGYVIYNYGVMAGFWPAFVGGLFGVSAVVFSFFGIAYLLKYPIARFSASPRLERVFLLFLLFLLVWTLCAFIVISNFSYSTLALQDSVYTLVIWVAVYFVAARYDLHDKKNYRILRVAVIFILFLFLHGIVSNSSMMGIFMIFNGSHLDGEIHATYQGVGRSILVMTLVLAAFQKRYLRKILIMVVAMIILVALGSRAHLFAMMALIVLSLGVAGFRRHNWPFVVGGVMIITAVSYFFHQSFFESRAAEIFDLDVSTSWQARLDALEEAMAVITANPFFGAFGYYIDAPEGYAHNLLSAWAQYGFAVFVLFIGMLIYSMLITLPQILRTQNVSPVWMIAFQLNFVAILLAIASEPINGSVFPALAWGFTVQALRAGKQQGSSPMNEQHTSGLLGAKDLIAPNI